MEQQGARRRAPTERYTDGELLSRYRFNGNGIAYLCDILQDDLKRETGRSNALNVEEMVCAALRFYACGSFQEVSDLNSYLIIF